MSLATSLLLWSCAIQQDACVDAATIGKLAGGVIKCDIQEDRYNAVADK